MEILYFILFNLLFYFSGRGFSEFINKKKESNIKIKNIDNSISYPLISIFIISNLIFVSNFFIPLKNLVIYFLLFFFFSILIGIIKTPKKDILNFNFLIKYLFIPGILGVSTYGSWLGEDAGLYHLGTQNWIYENKIVFGLTNINVWFGWSSIVDYFSSIFIFFNNYNLMSYLNLLFLCLFYSFIFDNLNKNNSKFLFNSSVLIIIFGVLDNFGVNGGANGYIHLLTIGKVDTILAVVYIIFALILFDCFYEERFLDKEFIFLTYFLIFIIQIKQTGLTLGVIYFIYIYLFQKKQSKSFLQIIRKIKIPVILYILWSIKNFIIAGCLIFPVSMFCFDVEWYEYNLVNFASQYLKNQYSPFMIPGNDFIEEIIMWSSAGKNFQFVPNFVFSFLFISVISLLFSRNDKKNTSKELRLYKYIFLVFSIATWFITAANFRFAVHIWMLLIALIGYPKSLDSIPKYFRSRYLIIPLFFIALVLTPRLYSYKGFVESSFGTYEITPPIIEYIEFDKNWVVPINADGGYGIGTLPSGSQCWENINCLENFVKVEEKILFGYKFFTLK